MATIKGEVSVSSNNNRFERVVGGTTSQILGVTGGTGDYLEELIVIVQGTTGSCALYLDDNNTGTIQVFGTVANSAGTFVIPLGVVSQAGPWRLTTQATPITVAVGRFK